MEADTLRDHALEALAQLELGALDRREYPKDLSSAVYWGQVDWAFEFLARGAPPSAHDVKSAASGRDPALMKLLLECGAPTRLGVGRSGSEQCIVTAACEGGLACLDTLIAAGAPTTGEDAAAAAEAAALAGDFACFQRLSDGWSRGPDAPERRAELIMHAQRNGLSGLSAYLQGRGAAPLTLPVAPPRRRRHDKGSAWDEGRKRAEVETRLLEAIQRGAFADAHEKLPESAPFRGRTAAEFAAQNGLGRAGAALLQRGSGSKPEQRILDGLLLDAAGSGATDMALHLIEQGADANAADDRGQDVLYHAAKRGDATLVEALLAAGAEVDHASDAGEYAYQAAVGFERARIEFAFRRASASRGRPRRPGVEVLRWRPRLLAPRGAMLFLDQLATGHPEAAIGAIEAPVEEVSATLMSQGGVERIEHMEKVGAEPSFDCCFVVGFARVPWSLLISPGGAHVVADFDGVQRLVVQTSEALRRRGVTVFAEDTSMCLDAALFANGALVDGLGEEISDTPGSRGAKKISNWLAHLGVFVPELGFDMGLDMVLQLGGVTKRSIDRIDVVIFSREPEPAKRDDLEWPNAFDEEAPAVVAPERERWPDLDATSPGTESQFLDRVLEAVQCQGDQERRWRDEGWLVHAYAKQVGKLPGLPANATSCSDCGGFGALRGAAKCCEACEGLGWKPNEPKETPVSPL